MESKNKKEMGMPSNLNYSDPRNQEVLERFKKVMQMNIEKYGPIDSSKVEKKLHFIDISKYFGKED